jgi:hypothetical protein
MVSVHMPDGAAKAQIVQLDDGPITLSLLPDLEAMRNAANVQIRQLESQAAATAAEAQDKLADAGAILVPRHAEWTQTAEEAPLIDQAQQFIQAIDAADADGALIAARPHQGISGFFKSFGDKSDLKKEQTGRAQLAEQLKALLAQVGATAKSSIPDVTQLQDEAGALTKHSQSLAEEGTRRSAEVNAVSAEIQRRRESIKQLGFDALYTTAYLKAFGAPPMTNPLVAKRGEQPYLVQPATLARQATKTQFVGGSQGFSFPIGHTGIRYRVGSYRGHAVQQNFIAHLDQGSLVITNQRVAFVGGVKSVSINLEKILHVEVYKDAIAVFREGKEAPDFFLTAQPQMALFYLNYVLDLRGV